MSLVSGTRLGPYEILSTIGAGAMGVVYRARDTRLGREVAIKVLPQIFAQDPDRLGRFEREARAVAAINHPNILAVHDIGSAEVADAEGSSRVTYMVTELLDGETLRNWIAQGPLPLRKSLDIAMQTARGLAAAHDRGIVHRDLKPENVVLLRDGHVKILDFGLARKEATEVAGGHGEAHTMAATDAGTILGTVGYMAPEQVRGEVADQRSDLFSLGVVLYELVTRRRAFERATAAETMAAILRDDPPELDASSSGSTMSPAVTRVLSHALEKDPSNRFQSARDFAFALQALAEAGSGSADRHATPPVARKALPILQIALWTAAVLVGIALVVGYLGFQYATRDAETRRSLVFAPVLPWHDGELTSPAVSPDSSQIAFIDHRAGDAIVVRDVASLTSRLLKGTDGARLGGVFWSPDGRSLGFFSGGKLKTIEIATGKIEQLAAATAAFGGSWSSDGTILYSPEEASGIFRINVNARDLDPVPVTTVDAAGRKEEAHRWPSFLPDGRHFIFVPWSSRNVVRHVHLGSLDGQAPVALFESESAPVVAGHHFIYVRDLPPRLLAQEFDPRTFALVGRPAPVIDDDNVAYLWPNGYPMLSASANLLVYSTGKYLRTQLTWVNRSGQSLGTVGEPGVHYDPELSPDGTSLLVERRDAETNNHDVWTVDLARGVFSRLTSGPSYENGAVWSPDGRRAIFTSSEGDRGKVRVKSASGVGEEDLILDRRAYPTDWSRDGRYLLLHADGTTGLDVWIQDFERKTAAPLLNTPFDESGARFSPDGRWIAYVSNDSRVPEVYIRSFPEGASRIQISTGGGTQPFWPKGGNEVFYLAPDTTLMAVDVRPSGGAITAGVPKPLFRINAEPMRVLRSLYTVTADGQKILLLKPQVDLSASPLVGVTRWADRLR